MTLHLDHRETSDTYRGELFRYGRNRVIICKDGIQWIVQRRKAGAGSRWAAISYCVTRKALERVWAKECSEYAPEMTSLPTKVNGGRSE